MKLSRITGTISVVFSSLALLFCIVAITESIHDQIEEFGPLPRISTMLDFFTPISYLLFVYPLLIGIAYWRLWSSNSQSVVLWHFLAFVFSFALASVVAVMSQYFILLDGTRPVTSLQVIGNTTMIILLGAIIILTNKIKVEQTDGQ